MKKIIVLLASVLLLSCDPLWGDFEYWHFIFRNHSAEDVIVMLDLEEVDGILVPSTSWSQDTLSNYAKVYAGETYRKEFDEHYIKYKMGDVMAVYVFSPDTLAKYTWSQIKADKNYLRRYDYVINWKEYITYP